MPTTSDMLTALARRYQPQDLWGGISIGGGGIPAWPGVPSWLTGSPVSPTGGGAAQSPLGGDLGASGGGSLGSGGVSTGPGSNIGGMPWTPGQIAQAPSIQLPAGQHWQNVGGRWMVFGAPQTRPINQRGPNPSISAPPGQIAHEIAYTNPMHTPVTHPTATTPDISQLVAAVAKALHTRSQAQAQTANRPTHAASTGK